MDLKDQNILHETVRKCAEGDRKAQQELYKFYYSKMMGVCYRYSKNPEDAKDLLHDGFIKVFNNLAKYNFNGSLEGWVRRIMVNTAIDFYRKNKNVYLVNEDESSVLENSKIESADNIYSQFGVTDIMEAIQALSPAYKTVFNLYAIEGYPHKEIAEMLNISEGTSKSNLAKARQKLRKLLEHRETEYHHE